LVPKMYKNKKLPQVCNTDIGISKCSYKIVSRAKQKKRIAKSALTKALVPTATATPTVETIDSVTRQKARI